MSIVGPQVRERLHRVKKRKCKAFNSLKKCIKVNQYSQKPAFTNHTSDSLVPIVREEVRIRNLLHYNLCFDVIDPKLGAIISFTLKTGADICVTPKPNQILVCHLLYMDYNWTFAEKFNSMDALQTTEFVAQGGRFMHLGWDSDELGYTIYSPMSVINKTDIDLAYFQVSRGPNHHRGMNIYPQKAFHPILLNFDITELYVSLSESKLQDPEEWKTKVPLDASTNIIKCSGNGFDTFISSRVYPNSDGMGKSIMFTSASVSDETIDQVISLPEVGWGTLTLRNDLPYDLVLEVTSEHRTKVPAGKQTTIMAKLESVLVFHLFYMGLNWMFEVNFDCNQKNLDTLICRATDGSDIMYLKKRILFVDDLQMILSLFSPYWIENRTTSPILSLQQNGDRRSATFTKTYQAPFSQPVLLNSDITRLFFAGVQPYGAKEDWKEVPLDRKTFIDLAFEDYTLRIKVTWETTSVYTKTISLHEITGDALNSACNQNINYVNVERSWISSELPVNVVIKIEDEENKYVDITVFSYRHSHGYSGGSIWSGIIPTNASYTITMDYMNQNWKFQTRFDSLVPELCECEFLSDQGNTMIVRCKYYVETDGEARFRLLALPELPSP